MAEQTFFSPQILAVINQMIQRYLQLSVSGYDYISISIEIARMLNLIANESEQVAVAQMLFRQGAYEALGIARLSEETIRKTQEEWRKIAPTRELILQTDALGDKLKQVLAAIQITIAQIIVENKDLIMEILQGIREVLQFIREEMKKHPGLVKNAVKAWLFFYVVSKIWDTFGGKMKTVWEWLTKIAAILGLTGGGRGIIAALGRLGPAIGGAIAAVVGVIGVEGLAIIAIILFLLFLIILIWKNWDKIKKWFEAWRKWKEAETLHYFIKILEIWNKLKEWWGKIKEFFVGLWNKTKDAWNNFV
jgi:phage-related minor tail protein